MMSHATLKVIRDSIQKSSLTPKQRLTARLALVNPIVRSAISDYLDELLAARTDGKTLIELILEYLPEIIALIELILRLLDD